MKPSTARRQVFGLSPRLLGAVEADRREQRLGPADRVVEPRAVLGTAVVDPGEPNWFTAHYGETGQRLEQGEYTLPVEFDEALARLGFQPSSDRVPRGARVLVARPNRFLTYTVQAFEDGTALFSWEFAVGEYLATKGIQFGSDETLNQFAYPRQDLRGPQDAAWLAGAVEQAEALLGDVRFDRPEG